MALTHDAQERHLHRLPNLRTRESGFYFLWGDLMAVYKDKQIQDTYASSSLLGQRYIFFKELQTTNSDLASNVEKHFDNINKKYFSKPAPDVQKSEQLNYLKNYLTFLNNLIKKEQENEYFFINQLITKLKENNDIANSKLGQELINKAEKGLYNMNLTEIINLLNLLLQDEENYLAALKNQLNNLDIYEQNLKKQEQEQNKTREQLEQELTDTFFNNTKAYDELFNKLRANIVDENNEVIKKWQDSTLSGLKKRIDDNLRTIRTTPQLKIKIIEAINSSSGLTMTEIINMLKQIAINAAIKKIDLYDYLDNNKVQELPSFQELLSKVHIETVFSNNNKAYATIEEQALKSGFNVAEKLLEIEGEKQQEQIVEKYAGQKGIDVLKKLREATKKQTQSAYKGQLTLLLRQGIQEQQQAFINHHKRSLQQASDEVKLEAFLKDAAKKQKITYNSIERALDLKVTIPDLAEISTITGNAVSKTLKGGYVGGKRILLKNDFMITWSWYDNMLSDLLHSSDISQKAKEALEKFIKRLQELQKNFLTQYSKKGHNTTKIEQAYRDYYSQMYALSKEYKKVYGLLYKNAEAQQKIARFLETFVLESVTVKEYESYNPTIGYKAGNLGAGGRVIDAVPNILKMYELGGISTINVNEIIEALLNCGTNMLAPADLVENFKNYLLGGAAMMLFDDGFANGEKFLEQMKQLFFNMTGPKQAHLLLLNQKYYPFSFILQQILNNLLQVYDDITNIITYNPERLITKNYLQITNNMSLPSDTEWEKIKPGNSAERWNWVSEKAQDTVTITFMFMGGILDILEKLKNAFTDI